MDRSGTRLRRRARRGSRQRWLRRALFGLSAALLITALVMLVSYIRQGNEARRLQQALRDKMQQAALAAQPTSTPMPAPTPLVSPPPVLLALAPPVTATPRPLPSPGAPIQPKLQSIYEQNHDMVGWLSSDAIYDIDFPVVHRDNSYYLDKDFHGRPNRAGTVFLDEGNDLLPQDQNLILHGHNMKDGTMFGKLYRLMDRGALAANPFFSFSSLYDDMTYVPYAVSLVSVRYGDQDYVDLMRTRFADEVALDRYVQTLRDHSVLRLPVDVDSGDRLLTLVTCHGKEDTERLVIALRSLRPEETRAAVQATLIEQAAAR